jgi:hypothetical protein
VALKDIGDGFFAEFDSQFDQFTLDFAIASVDIFLCEPDHEPFDLQFGARTSIPILGGLRPLASDHLAVPA